MDCCFAGHKLTCVQIGTGSGGRIVPVDRGRKVGTEVITLVADTNDDTRLWVKIRERKACEETGGVSDEEMLREEKRQH